MEQDRRELVLHVPGDVVGEQADQHVGADPAGEPVPDVGGVTDFAGLAVANDIHTGIGLALYGS